jgi:hypothetical protein
MYWAEGYKLRLETSLKSQASDWLKWRLVRCLRFEAGFHAQFYNLGYWRYGHETYIIKTELEPGTLLIFLSEFFACGLFFETDRIINPCTIVLLYSLHFGSVERLFF